MNVTGQRGWLAAREPRLRTTASIVGIIALVAAFIRVVVVPSSDFSNHRTWAAWFLDRAFLYVNGSNAPYLPFWALAHVPFALVPLRVAAATAFAVAVAAGAALLVILDRLTSASLPLDRTRRFWVAAATLTLTARFIVRDLADAGANLFVFGLVWIGLAAVARSKARLGCALIGLAAALKLTPALFIAYFFCRRWYVLALVALMFACLFTALPAAWLGARSFEQHMIAWGASTWGGVSQSDPAMGVLGLDVVGNQALRPALGRLLVTPMSTIGFPAPAIAALIVLLVAGLIAVVAWRLTHPAFQLDDPHVVWDWAALSVLALLISPITWRAHAIATIPSCYMIFRAWAVWRQLPLAAWIALALLAVPNIVLTRGIAGSVVDGFVHRWSIFTWAFVALLVATLASRAVAARLRPPAEDQGVHCTPWSSAGPQ